MHKREHITNNISAMLAFFIAPWQGQHYMALAKPLTVAEAVRRRDALAADIESLRRLDDPKALQAAVALVPVALLNVAGAAVANARGLKKKARSVVANLDLQDRPRSLDMMIDAALAADVRQLSLSAEEEAEIRALLPKTAAR